MWWLHSGQCGLSDLPIWNSQLLWGPCRSASRCSLVVRPLVTVLEYLRTMLPSIYFALRYQLFCVSSAYALKSDMDRYKPIDAVSISSNCCTGGELCQASDTAPLLLYQFLRQGIEQPEFCIKAQAQYLKVQYIKILYHIK